MVPDSKYEIGYGKPPKAYQYKKGQSGNPHGRPRKPLTIPELLAKVIRQKVRINGKNGPMFMTKLEASITQMTNKSASGDLEAFKLLLQMLKLFPESLKDEDREAWATGAQVRLLALVEARYGSCAEGSAEGDQVSDQPNSMPREGDGSEDQVRPAVEGGVGQSGEQAAAPARSHVGQVSRPTAGGGVPT